VKLEQARGTRARRYVFDFDEVAEAEAPSWNLWSARGFFSSRSVVPSRDPLRPRRSTREPPQPAGHHHRRVDRHPSGIAGGWTNAAPVPSTLALSSTSARAR